MGHPLPYPRRGRTVGLALSSGWEGWELVRGVWLESDKLHFLLFHFKITTSPTSSLTNNIIFRIDPHLHIFSSSNKSVRLGHPWTQPEPRLWPRWLGTGSIPSPWLGSDNAWPILSTGVFFVFSYYAPSSSSPTSLRLMFFLKEKCYSLIFYWFEIYLTFI